MTKTKKEGGGDTRCRSLVGHWSVPSNSLDCNFTFDVFFFSLFFKWVFFILPKEVQERVLEGLYSDTISRTKNQTFWKNSCLKKNKLIEFKFIVGQEIQSIPYVVITNSGPLPWLMLQKDKVRKQQDKIKRRKELMISLKLWR